jgi:hypothetical protein
MEAGLIIIFCGIFVTIVGMVSILISIIFHKDYETVFIVRKQQRPSEVLSSWSDKSEEYDVIIEDP